VFDLRCKCNAALPSALPGLEEQAGNC
jgi:hypothetical protein